MTHVTRRRLGAALALAAVLAGCGGGDPAPPSRATPAAAGAAGTWAASPVRTGEEVADETIRIALRTSVGGSGVVVRLTNAEGDRPLAIADVTLALQAGGATAVPGSVAPVTFAGQRAVTLPVGADVAGDPVGVTLPARAKLLVSVHVAGTSGPLTGHVVGLEPAFLGAAGADHAADASGAAFTPAPEPSRYLLDQVALQRPAGAGTVVAFGDSITDGVGSTPGADARWPDRLAERLVSGGQPMGVLDAGIGGNRVLTDGPEGSGRGASALHRFAADALDAPGVRTVVLTEGINDLTAGTSAQAVVAGLGQLVARAHARGTCVVGGTLTPDDAAPVAVDTQRQLVNAFIRAPGRFDAVADFDVALRDPDVPTRLQPAYDSGDGLHPSDAGYAAMATAVNPPDLVCRR